MGVVAPLSEARVPAPQRELPCRRHELRRLGSRGPHPVPGAAAARGVLDEDAPAELTGPGSSARISRQLAYI